MPDPVTTSAVALAVGYAVKESLTRVLGPTASYFGEEMKERIKARVESYGRISSSAERKSGSRLAEPGAVNARVFKKIMDDGEFCMDGLSADYYGGFLASSRTKDGTDDTNIPFVSMIDRMSADVLHGHWIMYTILFNKMHGRRDLNVYVSEHRKESAIYIPWRSFIFLFEALRADRIEDANPTFRFCGEDRRHSVILEEELLKPWKHRYDNFDIRRLDVVFYSLLNDRLVDKLYWGLMGWDLALNMREDFPHDPLGIYPKEFGEDEVSGVLKGGTFTTETSMEQGGVVFQPSVLGMDLFLRAQGLPPEGRIGFNSLQYDFCPQVFAEEILRNVRTVGSAAAGS